MGDHARTLFYSWLDVHVREGINLLLKSFLNIHTKTGCISVPIDLQKEDQFDPFTVLNKSPSAMNWVTFPLTQKKKRRMKLNLILNIESEIIRTF